MRNLIIAALVAFVPMTAANATRVFSTKFDGLNSGASASDYSMLSGLAVVDGTVDLIRSGDVGITCVGRTGACIDLDGTTNNGGTLQLQSFYAFGAGDTISFSFDLSGSQRGSATSFDSYFVNVLLSAPTRLTSVVANFAGSEWNPFNDMVLGGFSLGGNVRSQVPFKRYSVSLIAAEAGTVRFGIGTGSADSIGPVVDNLALDISASVPEPAQWALMIGGFGLIGAASRRRRRAVA